MCLNFLLCPHMCVPYNLDYAQSSLKEKIFALFGRVLLSLLILYKKNGFCKWKIVYLSASGNILGLFIWILKPTNQKDWEIFIKRDKWSLRSFDEINFNFRLYWCNENFLNTICLLFFTSSSKTLPDDLAQSLVKIETVVLCIRQFYSWHLSENVILLTYFFRMYFLTFKKR